MSELDTVARTLWAEARSHGLEGMAAVANVIANRVKNPGWWGRDFAGVCRAQWQFSCWNVDDPGHVRMLQVTRDDPHFADALVLARAAINGELRDRTKGADHYHAEYVSPKWSHGRKPTLTIGPQGQRHLFYRIGLHA